MITDTIEYKGYKIKIAQDEGPENPFEAWDYEPPLLTFYGGRHGRAKAYNDAPESLRDILYMLPDKTWERGERVKFFNEFMADKFGRKEVAGEIRRQGSTFEAFSDLLSAEYGETPSGWKSACEWFELAESLLKYAGIPCLFEHSHGHCQGDTTLCLAIALPEWLQTTGVTKEQAPAQLESAIELYSAWAWGDVYGVSEIIAPGPEDEDGEGIEGASCWGFYGSDHEKSGLMDHARDSIEYHIEQQAKEAETLSDALCSAE
jgi:hypothetical protein